MEVYSQEHAAIHTTVVNIQAPFLSRQSRGTLRISADHIGSLSHAVWKSKLSVSRRPFFRPIIFQSSFRQTQQKHVHLPSTCSESERSYWAVSWNLAAVFTRNSSRPSSWAAHSVTNRRPYRCVPATEAIAFTASWWERKSTKAKPL